MVKNILTLTLIKEKKQNMSLKKTFKLMNNAAWKNDGECKE